MTYSSAYTAHINVLMSDGTVAQVSDTLSRRGWWWEPPRSPKVVHDPPSPPTVVAPHILMRRCKPFTGHRFGLGKSR